MTRNDIANNAPAKMCKDVQSMSGANTVVKQVLHCYTGGKGIHYVGGYTQTHLTLWIRRMVGMLQLKK